MSRDAFYITTPIYYVNDKPHIGHAYTSLACDVLARFMRLDGKDVRLLTGTDEHGQKVEKSAATAGESPQAYADRFAAQFRELAKFMHYSNDDFIRTTEPRHTQAVQAFWKVLAKRGKGQGGIYLDSYAGWYSVRDEAFYAESELVDGKAPTGAPVEWVEEPSYFFELSYWQDKLLKFYEDNPDFIYPRSRYNEVVSFVKGGLQDLSISRTTFSWGIPVPGDEKHVMYVWLDALYNYVSALGGPGSPHYDTYWPVDVHMVGKDILRFHAVYWPAFLMAAEMPLPKRVVAHGWWTNEGQKISKSLGNVIDPFELVETYGLDQVRWFLLREVPFGNDGNFARESMANRINSELANTIGNLAQRTLSFIAKNGGGVVPTPQAGWEKESLIGDLAGFADTLRRTLAGCEFHKALEEIVRVATAANQYIDVQAPWTLRKTDPERMNTVLYVLVEAIRQIALAVQPVMPDAAARMLDQLGVESSARAWPAVDVKQALPAGKALPAPAPVFPRWEEKTHP